MGEAKKSVKSNLRDEMNENWYVLILYGKVPIVFYFAVFFLFFFNARQVCITNQTGPTIRCV